MKSHETRRGVPILYQVFETCLSERGASSVAACFLGASWVDLDLVCDRGDGAPLDPDAFGEAASKLRGMRLYEARHHVKPGCSKEVRASRSCPRCSATPSASFTIDLYDMTEQAADALDRAFDRVARMTMS